MVSANINCKNYSLRIDKTAEADCFNCRKKRYMNLN